MSSVSLKSLLKTAKARQLQERRGAHSDHVEQDALRGPSLAPAPKLPSPADYLSLDLFRALPPPARLTSSYRVQSAVPACYYITEWCDEEAEADMLRCCLACPAEQWVQLRGRRLQCWGNTPQQPNGQATVQSGAALSGMPLWLQSLMSRVQDSGLFSEAADSSENDSTPPLPPSYPPPDHVLINRYDSGQGIMAHKDGPAYQPLVAILSLASHTVMHFYPQPPHSAVYSGEERGQPVLSLLLERRSLLVFTDELYSHYYHCIHEQSEDVVSPRDVDNWQLLSDRQQWERQSSVGQPVHRSTRYSLTIRASKNPTH